MNSLFLRQIASPKRLLSQVLVVGALAGAGTLTGLVPSLSWQTDNSVSFNWTTLVHAQEISNDEITNYARAVLDIEPRRLQASQEIQNRTGSIPPIVCNETQKINRLPNNIRGIAVSYCDQAKKIIENRGLTVARFNEITLTQRQDSALKERIQNELIRLQQEATE